MNTKNETVIHAGLRQLGRDGLLRLKEWIESGKSLTFCGGYFNSIGHPSPMMAGLPVGIIPIASMERWGFEDLEREFQVNDFDPAPTVNGEFYLDELEQQTPETILRITNELLEELE